MSLHVPLRPGWLCAADGVAWPCLQRQQELIAEYMDAPEALVLHMSAQMVAAARELPTVSGRTLGARFMGWVPGGGVPAVLTLAMGAQFVAATQQLGDQPAGALYARFMGQALRPPRMNGDGGELAAVAVR